MKCVCFNDTATTEISTLSLHDALPISGLPGQRAPERCPFGSPGGPGDVVEASGLIDDADVRRARVAVWTSSAEPDRRVARSEEHTSEIQSRQYLLCRLLLEQKKT